MFSFVDKKLRKSLAVFPTTSEAYFWLFVKIGDPVYRVRTGICEHCHFDGLPDPACQHELPDWDLRHSSGDASRIEERIRDCRQHQDHPGSIFFDPWQNAVILFGILHYRLSAETGKVAVQFTDGTASSCRKRYAERIEDASHRKDHRHSRRWQNHGCIRQQGDKKDTGVAIRRKLFHAVADAVNVDRDTNDGKHSQNPQ